VEPRVIRLVPKPAPFADALRHYGAAKYHDCLDALRGNESLPAVILTARALLRLAKFGDERLDRAIELLEGTRGRADREGSDALRGELAMLLAASYHRAELPDEAERAFFDARVYLWSTRNAELQSELEYYEGIFAWSVRNLDAASRHARAALNKASLSVHARALELLGAIAASSGNYLGQADYLERALAHLETFSERDVWVEAHILYNLSILVRELHLDPIVERLGQRLESLPWTAETAVPRFEALRHVAWCHALSGNHVKAFRLLRESAEVAPTIPWRIFAFLDRSMLAREMGEALFAEDEMQGAEAIAEGFDWSQSSGDERLALLQLAELTAQRNPERAQHHIERYRSIKRKMSALHAFRADKRLRALECYAEASVSRALGQPDRAILLLNEAFEIWSSIGYAWRGVVSSLALYELTQETHFREYASINIQRFSASWITRRFELVFPAQRPWETPLTAAGSPGS
jgi:tetratricopeptide (TPR) repeat protein